MASPLKIGISGFGRIGRLVARQYFLNPEIQKHLDLVVVNDLGAPQDAAFSFKYDSTHGKFAGEVSHDAESVSVNGKKIAWVKHADAKQIPWKQYGVDLVFECTGRYVTKEEASAHLSAGAKKVIISAPAKGVDATIVMGVNESVYDASKHTVLSNASCTTNCLAPIVSVLHKKWGVVQGFITTVHSFTSDQRLVDNSHKDPRRARTASTNLIPTTTGAAKAVGEVIPELKGKLDGMSVRVPTPNVSLTDLVAELKVPVSIEEINAVLREAAQSSLKGVLSVCDEPLVSSDFNGNTHSSIVDSACTNVIVESAGKGKMVKVYSWYDNEVGFSCRMLDLATLIAKKGV